METATTHVAVDNSRTDLVTEMLHGVVVAVLQRILLCNVVPEAGQRQKEK